MNRRALLKFLLSAPAAAAVGLGSLVGRKRAESMLVEDWTPQLREDLEQAPPYSMPEFHDWDCDYRAGCTSACKKRSPGMFRRSENHRFHGVPLEYVSQLEMPAKYRNL